jgi:hypothetical protein
MKKKIVFILLLLSLFAYKVNAAPNTGTLPENGVKVNFNENGSVNSFEGAGWALNEQVGSLTLTKGDVVVTLNEFVFKNGSELVGFSWMVEGATAVLWVKHGTTAVEYGEGTSGEFTTSDDKGVSNAVFLIEIIEDEEDDNDDEEELDDEEDDNDDEEELDDEEDDNDDEEELDDEEDDNDDEEELDDEEDDNDDEEELDDEEDDNDDEEELDDEEDDNDDEEELDDEEEDDDDEVLGDDEEENDEEDEVLGEDDEQLPDTSDASRGLGLVIGLFGLFLFAVSKKKVVA